MAGTVKVCSHVAESFSHKSAVVHTKACLCFYGSIGGDGEYGFPFSSKIFKTVLFTLYSQMLMWVQGLPTHQLCFVVVFNISNASKSGTV